VYNKTQFWDGRAKTLEDQATHPIVNSCCPLLLPPVTRATFLGFIVYLHEKVLDFFSFDAPAARRRSRIDFGNASTLFFNPLAR
jgi:hypothetical protein